MLQCSENKDVAKATSEWDNGIPYLRLYTSLEEVKTAWAALKVYRCNFHDHPSVPYLLHNVKLPATWVPTGQFLTIPVEKQLYYTINFLTDFFTEPGRLQARRYNQPTAVDYWKQ